LENKFCLFLVVFAFVFQEDTKETIFILFLVFSSFFFFELFMCFSFYMYVVRYRLPGDNPFYSNIDSMPDIRPRRKSIPLVSELVTFYSIFLLFPLSFSILIRYVTSNPTVIFICIVPTSAA